MKVVFLGHARSVVLEQLTGSGAIVELAELPQVGDRFLGREHIYRVKEIIRPLPGGAAPQDNPNYPWDALVFLASYSFCSGDNDCPINLQR